MDPAAYGPPIGRRFALLCGATLLQFVAVGLLLGSLPLFLTRDLHTSKTAVGLVVGSYSIAAVLSRPVVGRRLDRHGRRWFLAGAPVVMAVSTLALLAANAVAVVVALRMVQGVAGAAFYTAAATVATDLAPEERRGHYISRFSLFLYGGFAIGPTLATAVIDRGGFGAAWIVGALSAAGAAAVAVGLPETRPASAVDAAGAHADNAGGRWATVVHPASVGPGLVLVAAAVGYTAISVFAPLYAERIGMASAGPLYLAFALTIIGVRLVGGGLADRFGRVAVALPGLLLGSAGLALLAAVPRPGPALVGVGAFAAGFALLFPALMALAADRAPEAERGAVLGSFTAFFDLGAFAGGYLVGAVVDARGYTGAFGAASVLCLVAGVGLVRTGRRVPRSTSGIPGPLPDPAGG